MRLRLPTDRLAAFLAAPARLARSVVRFAVVTVVTGMAIAYVMLVSLVRVLEPMLVHTRALEQAAVGGVVVAGVLMAVAAAVFRGERCCARTSWRCFWSSDVMGRFDGPDHSVHPPRPTGPPIALLIDRSER